MRAERHAPTSSAATTRQIDSQARLARTPAFFFADVLAPVLLAIAWLLVPLDVSPLGRWVGAAVLVGIGPGDRLIRRCVPSAWVNFGLVAMRLGLGIFFVAAVPSLWHAGAVAITGQLVAAIPAESRNRILSSTAVALSTLTALAIWRGIDHWYYSIILAAIGTVTTDIWFREWDRERRLLHERHGELVDLARMFSWEVDSTTGLITSVAGNVEGVTGYAAADLVGQHIAILVADPSTLRTRIEESDTDDVVEIVHRDGGRIVVREARLDFDESGIVRGVSVDITDFARASEALRYQAEHDDLTGLANRSVVEASVDQALADPDKILALVLADLDRFKEINDTLGHDTGDRVLRVLSQRFERAFPEAEVIARMGGDEFAFLLTGDCAADPMRFAERVHAVAIEPIQVDGLSLAVACSVGVSHVAGPDTRHDYAELLRQADIATYEVKRRGGGSRQFESNPDSVSIRRLQLVSEASGAVERNEFKMYFQPIVDLATGEIVGAEGLARWQHPEFGLLLPGQFLSAIEVAASYDEFTDEMIRQAIDFAAEVTPDGSFQVAVNLGSRSFLDRALPDRIRKRLEVAGVDAGTLTLEITESDLLDEQQGALAVVDALKRIGVRLSIDDFGTGYSNLTRLRGLDVEEVKIDRAFVAGLGQNSEDAIIVRSVVELGHSLGLAIVAEGIESIEQLEHLRRVGCPHGQGYFFARPMPRNKLMELVRAEGAFAVSATAAVSASAE